MSSAITKVTGWEALDSRGRPTVAAQVTLADGAVGTAIVPSGASAGSHEAVELRDRGTHALDLLTEAIEAAGHAPGSDIAIAIDVAATQLHHAGRYRLAAEQRDLSAAGLVEEIASWCDKYPIVSVEDVLAEDDWDGWQQATEELGARLQLIGDDLFVTQVPRLRRGIDTRVANAVLVKVNQNGLLSGARLVLEVAQAAGYRTVVSARSGETEDSWLADLAVGWRAGQIKVGSTHRSERTAKWNRLLQLEATEDTEFAGWHQR
jgi:enolase